MLSTWALFFLIYFYYINNIMFELHAVSFSPTRTILKIVPCCLLWLYSLPDPHFHPIKDPACPFSHRPHMHGMSSQGMYQSGLPAQVTCRYSTRVSPVRSPSQAPQLPAFPPEVPAAHCPSHLASHRGPLFASLAGLVIFVYFSVVVVGTKQSIYIQNSIDYRVVSVLDIVNIFC